MIVYVVLWYNIWITPIFFYIRNCSQTPGLSFLAKPMSEWCRFYITMQNQHHFDVRLWQFEPPFLLNRFLIKKLSVVFNMGWMCSACAQNMCAFPPRVLWSENINFILMFGMVSSMWLSGPCLYEEPLYSISEIEYWSCILSVLLTFDYCDIL